MADDHDDCPVCGDIWFESCFHCGWPRLADSTTEDTRAPQSRGLETVPEPTHTRYRALADRFIERAPDPAQAARPLSDGPEAVSIDPLRSRSPAETALNDAGFHAWNVGVSVTIVSAFKQKRRYIDDIGGDTRLYGYLVRDAAGANCEFWRAYNGIADHEQFLADTIEGEYGSSAENVARTYRWARDELAAPTRLQTRQAGLGEF